ncbi:sorting nexin-8, partial [Lecanoromycetidae sp. Uapishka_2]
MSLFGSSPDDSSMSAPQLQKSSLFDDEQRPSTKSANSLFDDEAANGDSPWAMPTPKKTSKSDLVKSLLPASDVPESYIDAFDTLADSGYKEDGGMISLAGAKKIFDGTGIDISEQDRIIRTSKVSENLERTSPKQAPSTLPTKSTTPGSSPTKSRRLRKDSLENIDEDPWASPALHKGHTHIVNNEATPSSNPTAAKPLRNGLSEPSRTTSAFTTHSEEPAPSPMAAEEGPSGPGWGSDGPTSSGFSGSGLSGPGGTGFGSSGDEQGNSAGGGIGRSIGGGRTVHRGVEENVTVTLLPEKEGIFMFQHHNYEVKSARRASAAAVAHVQHQELAVWRKQATISVQEEFLGKSLPPDLEDSLPKNLADTFETVRSGVKQSSEQYISLCGLLERLAKRNQGIAADYLRFSQALMAVTESSQSTYATDTNDVPLLNEGISSTAKHLTTSQSLLEDEARAWDEGVLEDLKKQRDTLVSVRDMFDRKDRYAKDNIPYLERRIESNENKLAGLMGRPEGTTSKPGEQEKLEQAVRAVSHPKNIVKISTDSEKDKQSIVDQHARGVFITECIRDELLFFQQSQYHVSRLHQEWSQERVKYAELQADNWRALSEEVDNMPLGE